MNTLLTPQRVKEIQVLANQILAETPSGLGQFERLIQIANDHGIKIMQSDLSEISGALRKEKDGWVIYVNTSDSTKRQLFTIAHELGHFFVHKEDCDEFIDGQLISRNEQEKYALKELEANEFAGNLIMPEELVRSRVTGQITVETLQLLAKSFGVSTMAMEIRLRNLGYDLALK